MTQPALDIVAIGDALVDVIATCDDAFLVEHGLPKGLMQLLDAEAADRLYAAMGNAREMSGGSAANTMAGIAAMGGNAAFIGQVADDQLGEIFRHDMRALGVRFDTPPLNSGSNHPTGRCLILVTPDTQRTMNTCPGASHQLQPEALDEPLIAAASILMLEGYLWGPELPRKAMQRAIEVAHDAGRKIAFTLSESVCIPDRREGMLRVIQDGVVRRVGSEKEDAVVDVRFISATNRVPQECVAKGTLREDLLYRLRVVPINLPPLRKRPEDIPLLANHFFSVFWERHRGPNEAAPKLSEDAIEFLRTRPWRGTSASCRT